MKRIWAFFKQPTARWGLIAGVVATVLLGGGFTTAIGYTNTQEFCISCHSMGYPYAEYKQSYHFKNGVGVQAGCPDCHVPHEYPDVLIAKLMAAKDVYGEIVGSIDTQEKFEGKRLEMAERVWAKMEATHSRECRNCHQLTDMVLENQGRRARRVHTEAIEQGKHCINCHKGVVHELPEGYEES